MFIVNLKAMKEADMTQIALQICHFVTESLTDAFSVRKIPIAELPELQINLTAISVNIVWSVRKTIIAQTLRNHIVQFSIPVANVKMIQIAKQGIFV